MADLIDRQAAIAALTEANLKKHMDSVKDGGQENRSAIRIITELPSAQPEPLTDKEQRIFLAAMGREEKVCKQVDEECRDSREPYEDSLVRVCREIERKVKKALWTK